METKRDIGGPRDMATFPAQLRGRRVLVCSESFGPVNGVSRTTSMIVDHLRTQGALVSVVAPYSYIKGNNVFASAFTARPEDGYTAEVRLKGDPIPFSPELSVVYPVRLSELYKRTFGQPPDLIYLASPASLGFQVLLQLRQQCREEQVPLLCNYQTDLAGYSELLFPIPFGRITKFVFSSIESYLYRHSSVKTVFYPSLFARKYLEEVARVESHKLSVLRRGVNTEGFNPLKASPELRKKWAPNGELILFTCSRLAGEKGYDFLAQAAAELAETELDFKLVIVGGNRNSVVEQQIKDMFAPLVRDGKVIFTGFILGEELMTHYASADIFLHCSVTETFGLVVLEAMASGVPVIARDEGGPSDTVDHGRNGYLVQPNDLQCFVERVLDLAYDHQLRKRFARAGRVQALSATWEMIGNKVAWKMVDAIEEKESAKLTQQQRGQHAATPSSWVVKVKTAASLMLIISVWASIGLCLVTINIAHWLKS